MKNKMYIDIRVLYGTFFISTLMFIFMVLSTLTIYESIKISSWYSQTIFTGQCSFIGNGRYKVTDCSNKEYEDSIINTCMTMGPAGMYCMIRTNCNASQISDSIYMDSSICNIELYGGSNVDYKQDEIKRDTAILIISTIISGIFIFTIICALLTWMFISIFNVCKYLRTRKYISV